MKPGRPFITLLLLIFTGALQAQPFDFIFANGTVVDGVLVLDNEKPTEKLPGAIIKATETWPLADR